MAQAESHDPHNGYFWLSLNEAWRLQYVIGFCDGALAVNELWQVLTQSSKSGRKAELEERIIDLSAQGELASRTADFANISYGQILEGLDQFYSDFRNKRIHVRDAIQYVRDQIKGKSAAKLQQMIDVLRKLASHEGYD